METNEAVEPEKVETDQEFEEEFARLSRVRDGLEEPEQQEAVQEVAEEAEEPEEIPEGEASQEQQEAQDLPSDVLAELDRLKKQNDLLEQQLRSDRGRMAPMTRKINELQAELNQHRSRTQAQKVDNKEINEKWAKFKEEWPDEADAIEARLGAGGNNGVTRQELEHLIQSHIQPLQMADQQRYVEGQFAALKAAHPDYAEVAQSAEFHGWLGKQPQAVQSLISSTAASDAAWLLTQFKQTGVKKEVPGIAEKRAQQLARGEGISTKRMGRRTDTNVGTFEAEFARFAREKDKQLQAHR